MRIASVCVARHVCVRERRVFVAGCDCGRTRGWLLGIRCAMMLAMTSIGRSERLLATLADGTADCMVVMVVMVVMDDG